MRTVFLFAVFLVISSASFAFDSGFGRYQKSMDNLSETMREIGNEGERQKVIEGQNKILAAIEREKSDWKQPCSAFQKQRNAIRLNRHGKKRGNGVSY